MTTCPACGSEVGRGDPKCPSCGTQLAGTAQMGVVAGPETAAVPEEIGPADQPSFVVVKGPDTGERFVLKGDEVTIGRDPDSRHLPQRRDRVARARGRDASPPEVSRSSIAARSTART